MAEAVTVDLGGDTPSKARRIRVQYPQFVFAVPPTHRSVVEESCQNALSLLLRHVCCRVSNECSVMLWWDLKGELVRLNVCQPGRGPLSFGFTPRGHGGLADACVVRFERCARGSGMLRPPLVRRSSRSQRLTSFGFSSHSRRKSKKIKKSICVLF